MRRTILSEWTYRFFRIWRFVLGASFLSFFLLSARPSVAASDTGLTLITPSSSSFSVLIRQYFGELTTLDDFASAQPYMVIVRNDGLKSIHAFTVRCDYSQEPGMPEGPGFTHFVYDPDIEVPMLDNHSEPLRVGDIRLIIPGYLDETPTSALQNPSRVKVFLHAVAGRAARITPGVHPAVNNTVDAVVYKDGKITGPDSDHLFEKYSARIAAQRDEDSSIQAMLATLGSRKELDKVLREHSALADKVDTSPTGNISLMEQREYTIQKSLEAQRLRILEERGGIPAVRQHTRRLLNRPAKLTRG